MTDDIEGLKAELSARLGFAVASQLAGRRSDPRGRSTGPLFDKLARLHLAPNQVARLLAPFPVSGRASYRDDGVLTSEGIDIFAARGTPVIASANGVVSRMTSAGRNASSLRLTAHDGTYYLYADLERFVPSLANGQKVAKGSFLGFVGGTGQAAMAPYLHFEIHQRNGDAVSPVPYLDRWLDEASQSISTLAAAPAAKRSSVLRSELQRRAARSDGVGWGSPVGIDLGRMRMVASSREAGLGGVLVVLVVIGWSIRRWARLRSREEEVHQGWSIDDLIELSSLLQKEEERLAAPVGG